VDDVPVIDLSRLAESALIRILEAGRIVGRDSDGRRLIQIPVDDWIVDWFGGWRHRQASRRQAASFRGKADSKI
jgi:hypothetical protein